MGTLLRRLVAIVVIAACSVTSDMRAMQGLIANSYHRIFSAQQQSKTKHKPDYSINLMWINKKLKKDQKFLHPLNDEFTSIICQWAALNKNGVINVWYDEEMTTTDAIKNTRQAIKQECLQYPEKAPIVLKNVRKLPEVKEHPKVFSDKIPIFFRVDLLRAIAGFNHVSRGKVNNFVYSDLDAESMSEDQIFDEKTKEDLKQYGMVMAQLSECPGYAGFENSFQIISNHKPNLLQAKKFALIDLNIKRAHDIQDKNLLSKPLEQKVYYSYKPMFEYFYHLEKCGTLKVFSDKSWESYNKRKYGLKSFDENLMYFEAHHDWCKEKNWDTTAFIPRKEVNVPLSVHFGPKKTD